jgi:glycosyltransferase involved in cell wall biosynthesis
MKIGIYDPYLESLGGGENYILTIASCLAGGHDVQLFWNDKETLVAGQKRFNIDLSGVKVVPNIFSPNISFLKKILATRSYDVLIFVSDGSIPVLLSKKNFLILQHPVSWVKLNYSMKLKLKNIQNILVYSEFVKKFIDKTFGVKSVVFAPAVNQIESVGKKENIILTVGRFTQGMNTKKQEDMIAAFKQICDTGLKGWEFVLIGSTLKENAAFITDLKKSANGYPIKILPDLSYSALVSYYQKAKIYWHAAGYGEDLEEHPEHAEHFGISTVEAMGAGAVPVVINAGGQKEIVRDKKNGFLWNSPEELQNYTKQLIKDQKLWETMSKQATLRAKDFSKERFCKEILELINQ